MSRATLGGLLAALSIAAGLPFGRLHPQISRRIRSKYMPHQGARECERRRVGGFYRLHGDHFQGRWAGLDYRCPRCKNVGLPSALPPNLCTACSNAMRFGHPDPRAI